ncbi:hypothetical protein [Thalassovita mangrovi]|uniref:Uncharacterized protein n=1 Tax=Thalassovita mangrovi TaxID=2692236 RepID=A0A6L8LJF1_9RHOB|nr:hypothetical protein [Thalassovita mangrovi]MYM54600.1 hypothetical protein [Thalassovita mangrovi]
MTGKIGTDLLQELAEVQNAAISLEQAIEAHNFLPDDFPRSQVEYLIISLSGLPNGSLEGVRAPLEHASVRLSEVRRRFFYHSDPSEQEDEENAEPTLERGDSLDHRFVSLLSAISTALDAYREQARSDFETTNTHDYLEVLPQLGLNASTRPPIARQIELLGELSGDAMSSDVSDERHVNNLGRSAADARNLLASTKAEVESKFVIRGWLRTLSSKSADALKVLRISIDAIEVSGGVAAEFYKKFKGTISSVRDVAIEESREWLRFISRQLERAEKTLRETGEEKTEHSIGVIRAMSGQKLVVTEDDIPFAVHPQERVLPEIGRVVSFNVDMSDGKPLAREIKENLDYLVLNKKFIRVEEAYAPAIRIIESIVESSNLSAVPISHIERKTVRSGLLPSSFWKSMGYPNLGSFAVSGGNLFAYPDDEKPAYLGSKPFTIRSTSKELVKEWALDYLSEKGGKVKIGDLAQAAALYFSGGVLPVRHQLGGLKFSDIFLEDIRFAVGRGMIGLTDQT